MTDSIFWQAVAVGGLVLLAVIAFLLVLNLRRKPIQVPRPPSPPPTKPAVDGDLTLTAFNALVDRQDEYDGFDRPDPALLDVDNFNDYIPQLREFSESALSVAAPLPEVHMEGVDPLLVRWDDKMVAYFAAVAEHQSEYAALIERALAHEDGQTIVGWLIESAIGFYANAPLTKVQEHLEAGKFFEAETSKLIERQNKLISQRDAYLGELERLKLAYAKRWDWEVEKEENGG